MCMKICLLSANASVLLQKPRENRTSRRKGLLDQKDYRKTPPPSQKFGSRFCGHCYSRLFGTMHIQALGHIFPTIRKRVVGTDWAPVVVWLSLLSSCFWLNVTAYMQLSSMPLEARSGQWVIGCWNIEGQNRLDLSSSCSMALIFLSSIWLNAFACLQMCSMPFDYFIGCWTLQPAGGQCRQSKLSCCYLL